MLEPLWAEPQAPREAEGLAAARAIGAVHVSYIEDLDKLEAALRAGGGFLEMRAAVDAYQTLATVARELGDAAKRATAAPAEDR